MDSVLPNFPTSNPKHSHFVAILTVIVIIVLIFLGYVIYLYVSTPATVSEIAAQPIPLLQQRVTLTTEQAAAKEKIIESTDTSQIKLTKAQAQDKTLKIKQMQELR